MKKELHGIEVILWVFIFCPEAPKPVCPICSEEYVQASEITDSNIPHSYLYLLTFFFSKDLLVFTPAPHRDLPLFSSSSHLTQVWVFPH